MRPIYLTQTGVGSTQVVPMDRYQNPFNVGIGVVVTGTVDYTVEHTFDDVFGTGTLKWFPHEELAALTASDDGNYAFAVTGIRLTVNSGDGSAAIKIVQSGSGVG